jgi:cell division protein FtsW
MFDLRTPLQALRREEIQGRPDAGLLLLIAVFVAFGVVMVASSSVAVAEGEGHGQHYYLLRHLVFLGMGGCGAWLALQVPMRLYDQHSRVLLLLCFLLLLAVFLPGFGVRVNGAKRWLRLGISNFQAVEAVKLLLILYLGSYLVRFAAEVQNRLLGIIKPLAVVALLVLLLLQQPDFGSSMLLLSVVLGMLWLAGARASHLAVLMAPAVPLIAWVATAEAYRLRRFTSFLDPFADPFRDGFQLVQALIAIGRGEWFGVGLGGSVQKLFYLPEAHTDFIFAVIAEELGFLGVCAVLLGFVLLCARIFRIGREAISVGQHFQGLVAWGIGLWFAAQATVSIGVNLGLLPTKGLTLPLISSGGSSLMMSLVALGVVLRVMPGVAHAQ